MQRAIWMSQVTATICLASCLVGRAQAPIESGHAQQVVQAAVQSELQAARVDRSLWQYRDEDDTDDKRALYDSIETPQGELRHLIALNGQPLSPDELQKESRRIQQFVQDQAAQAKARKNGQHDDDQATQFLKMLPTAFIWTVQSETPQTVSLSFTPNPNFQPPTLESRVLAVMAGTMVIAKDGDRIQSLRGKLTRDVKFGYGLLGKMDAGGTFNVERRQVGGGHWEITQTHVHIAGHALLFKSIGQQEDEVKTEWSPSDAPTLAQAERELLSRPEGPNAGATVASR